MGTSFKNIMVVAILFATTINSTCKKNLICADNNTYTFINNYAKTYPDRDSIHIGDTIWIEFNLPIFFKDNLTQQMIDFSNSPNFGNHLSELKFIGGSLLDPGSSYATERFRYILIKGKLAPNSSPNYGQNYFFSEENNYYLLKIGIVPDSLGIYALTISDAEGVHRRGDNCTKASFAFQFTNTNQHLYYYQNNRPGYVISDYERQHMYCFKVY
jgi:hypothetical protein